MTAHALSAARALLVRHCWRGAFLLWSVASLLLVASLGAAHWYSMPAPQRENPLLIQALAAARTPESDVVLLHFLYAKCACSQRVFSHLRTRRALPRVAEEVVLVDGEPGLRGALGRAGFRVRDVDPIALERQYGVVAAPLLVAAGRDARPLYVGGYTERKQGLELIDTQVVAAVRRGAALGALPLFGCAVSARLQRLVDPLGLKYPAPRGDDP